jgi:SAM-dependent methyltransferase
VPEYVRFRGLTVGRCPHCRTGQVLSCDGEPPPDGTAEDYSRRYQQELLEDKACTCWELLRRQAGGLQGVRSIFDLGCGQGAFLNFARAAGLYTAGVELAGPAATKAAQAGHAVVCGSVTEVPLPGRSFDVVTMWDLLEHLERPRLALRYALQSLAPGGRLFIATPAMGTIFDRLGLLLFRLSGGALDQLLRMCWTRDHLHRFERAGVCRALLELGFARVRAAPLLLLSLRPDRYAGGAILPSWTGLGGVDRLVSAWGVRVARGLRLHNKILIEAARGDT